MAPPSARLRRQQPRQPQPAQAEPKQARPGLRRRSLGESLALFVWMAMMLVWLVAWVFGAWWVLPVVMQLELNLDLIGGLFWLVTGAVAWMVAFVMGYRRYWAT
jgi:hypothetical protein